MPTHRMPDRPLVSVVMSVFNGGRFLDAAIQSIRRQTFDDFEFVIIDDGSTDGSCRLLERHAAEDPRLRVITQENRGLIESLNLGFQQARGLYIARMDADDIAKPQRLEHQVAFLSAHPSITLLGGAIEIIDEAGQPVGLTALPASPDQVRRHMRELGCALAHPTVMFRAEAVQAVGGFRRAYRHAEDYDLWLRLLERFDLANLEEVLLSYRRHEGSVSSTYAVQQILSAFCARVTARLRLEGRHDPTSEVELITPEVLAGLGVSRQEVDEAVLSGLLEMTEDAIRLGQRSAAAEFLRLGRPYGEPGRVQELALQLNRKAAAAPASIAERNRHRLILLEVSPAIYREVFRPASGTDTRSQPGNGRQMDMAALTNQELDRLMMDPAEGGIWKSAKGPEVLRGYERAFAGLRRVPISLLHLGNGERNSLLMWREFFPLAAITSVTPARWDPPLTEGSRILHYECASMDTARLEAIASEAATGGFHIIIDDASHIAEPTAAAFSTLFYSHLRPGGFYAIEAWGTGYWESWPDGARPVSGTARFTGPDKEFRSHQHGMVGFLKQLVDECGLRDIQHPVFGTPGDRRSYVRSLYVGVSLVIIEKDEA